MATLLGGDALAAVASWADDVREQRPETTLWHFVNIPRRATRYAPARDCRSTPLGDCIVAAIERFKGVLADRAAESASRAEALKFIVHLVGDLHQPLHCANDNDRGGNTVAVTFFRQATDLHRVWDSGLIAKMDLGETDYARHLEGWLAGQRVAALQGGTTISWALEAHRSAAAHAYRIPASKRLGGAYYDANEPVVDRQLARAGVRLARLLNTLLR